MEIRIYNFEITICNFNDKTTKCLDELISIALVYTNVVKPKALKFFISRSCDICVVGVMMNDAMIIFIVVITIN